MVPLGVKKPKVNWLPAEWMVSESLRIRVALMVSVSRQTTLRDRGRSVAMIKKWRESCRSFVISNMILWRN